MKKLQWMLAAGLICGSIMFTGCSDSSSTPSVPDESVVSQKLVGKWMLSERNGEKVLTNQKMVITVESQTRGYVSASFDGSFVTPLKKDKDDDDYSYSLNLWKALAKHGVTITGNTLIVTEYGSETDVVQKYTISSITDDEMVATMHLTFVGDDESNKARENRPDPVVRFVKVKDDFSKDIVALWEGKSTSEKDEYDDGKLHRWKFSDDEDYLYFEKDGDSWVVGNDYYNEYFVDGNLLCFRWFDLDSEKREWWEIESIKDGVMKWTALRKDEDGKEYTASFELKQPKMPAQKDVEKYMIGKWVPVDADGYEYLTDYKTVTTFESTKKGYRSASIFNSDDVPDLWSERDPLNIKVKDNKISFSEKNSEYGYTVQIDYSIVSISDKEMTAFYTESYTDDDDGDVFFVYEEYVRMVKVTDMSKEVIGLWEGKITSDKSEYDDGQDHRWEYKDDGTYVYYSKVDGEWEPVSNKLNEYFVDGNLLCTRWVDEDGNEYREWWDISSIKDGVMKWTAYRMDDNYDYYTASFKMKKVTSK